MKNQKGNISKDSEGYKVEFERVLPHPIEKVWNAITQPDELKYWFTDIEMDFTPGGEMTIWFRDEARTRSAAKIITIEPPSRFVWSWEDELAEWELTAVDHNTTKLKFTYSKIQGDWAVNVSAGFHHLLDQLEARLTGSEKIYAFGAQENDPETLPYRVQYASAVFNHYPELVKHEPVVVEKTLNASAEKVWQALTNKDEMKQWYFDLDAFRAEVGFIFRFAGQGHKGEKYTHVCIVTEVVPMKKLQYSWSYEGFPGYSLVTFELQPEGELTRLTLTHHGLDTFPQDNEDFARSSFQGGWNEIIGNMLPNYLEKSGHIES